MNGAMAELCANTTNPPTTINIKTIGVSHHHLRCQKNCRRSPRIPMRFVKSCIKVILDSSRNFAVTLFDYVITKHQYIHAAFLERMKSFLRCIHDGFASEIKRGVENYRN